MEKKNIIKNQSDRAGIAATAASAALKRKPVDLITTKCTQTKWIDTRMKVFPACLVQHRAHKRTKSAPTRTQKATTEAQAAPRTFIAPPVRGICRVMSERRPLQVHRESNHYVFPLSDCLCVWSKHNVMAKRAAANHSAHTGAGIFSSQSASTHHREWACGAVHKDPCESLTDASCHVHRLGFTCASSSTLKVVSSELSCNKLQSAGLQRQI